MNKQIYQLEDQIKLYHAQHTAQAEEKKFLREAVSEANMELEVWWCTHVCIAACNQVQ